MSPEERDMIGGLFDRMRSFGTPEKDREAEAFISQAVRRMPDAPYMLVQSVLVQENALQQAGARIEDLEAQVRELDALLQQRQAPAAASGGFLGGLFGGSKPSAGTAPAASRSSVPQFGARAQPAGYQPQGGAGGGAGAPWGQQGGQQGGGFAGQPMQQQPMQQQRAGGGFMKTAMATAAGVAGGMLLANSIGGMMGGNQANAAGAAGAGSAGTGNESYGPSGSEASYGAAADDNDPGGTYDQAAQGGQADQGGGYEQAADNNDPGGSWGGGGGGDDIEI